MTGCVLFGSFFAEIPFLFRMFCAMLNTLVVILDHTLCRLSLDRKFFRHTYYYVKTIGTVQQIRAGDAPTC